VTGTVAAAGEAGFWAPGPDMVRAVRAPGGWRLYGHRWFVVAAHVADIVVVPAITDDGLGVFLAETRALGFTASGQLGLDLTRRVCVTAFDEVPAVLLARDEVATAALEQAERDFLLATAAEAAGGIGWCLDAAIAYARDREQFGSPNGSFAALAQACVDMLAQFQEITATARSAAITAAEGSEDAAVAAHVAALRAGEAYRTVTESATKLFGGVGVSWEHDAHLYYRRAWSADRLSGGPQAHRAAIIDLHGPVAGPVRRDDHLVRDPVALERADRELHVVGAIVDEEDRLGTAHPAQTIAHRCRGDDRRSPQTPA